MGCHSITGHHAVMMVGAVRKQDYPEENHTDMEDHAETKQSFGSNSGL